MKKIIIIGAGIAGLSAGIYAKRSGCDVTIYESHFLPGGLCTSWKRKGFMFEGCMHYIGVVGSSPGHVMYDQWKELGVVPKTKMYHQDIFHTFQDNKGRTLNMYTNINKLEEEFLRLSPVDEKVIKILCKTVRLYSWLIRKTGLNPFMGIAKIVGIMRAIPFLKKYGQMNMEEYARRFRDPLLRKALAHLFVRSEMGSTSIFFFLAGLHIRGAAFPQGSSLAFARTIEDVFLKSGGSIEYRKKVKRIIVENNTARGIELEDGRVETADIIVSAADGYATLFDMLENRFTPPTIKERFENSPLYPGFIQVSLGVNMDLTGTPHVVKAETSAPFEVAGEIRQELWFQHFAFDKTMAPEGKTSITVLYPSSIEAWEKVDYKSGEYKEEKQKILETTIAQLENFIPGISSAVEIADVATPYTTLRYTHNRKGALGFMMTKELAGDMMMNPQYTLPGLNNFYMTGQWVKGFGIPMAAAGGKEVVQKICKDVGMKFKVK